MIATFPIVGIGDSAGGLEALDHFLGRVPTGIGMAFVIVQHLDPTRKRNKAPAKARRSRKR